VSQTLEIKATPRNKVGSRTCRELRTTGRLPAIIYGHGEAVVPITLDRHDFEVAIGHGARLLKVGVGGKDQPCLIKEIQYDHLQVRPIHVDLTRVDLTERVRVTVGIELRGVPKGVTHGGVLDQLLAKVEVECVVTDIPDTLHPLVTDLEIGQSLFARDLQMPAGVTLLTGGDERVATVHAHAGPAEAAPAAEAAEGATAEPERIGRVRKEEEPEA